MTLQCTTSYLHAIRPHRVEFAIVCLRHFADTHSVTDTDLGTIIEASMTEVLATWSRIYSLPASDRQVCVEFIPPAAEDVRRSHDILDNLFRKYRISVASMEHVVFDVFTIMEFTVPNQGHDPELPARLVAEIVKVSDERLELHANVRRSMPH